MVDDLRPSVVLDDALSLDYFEGKNPAIPFHWKEAHEDQRLVVIVGENASGKSFLRRVVYAIHKRDDCELIHLSMEGRKGYMASMIYGDEGRCSTGENSVRTVLGAIQTAESRGEELNGSEGKGSPRKPSPTAIFWDEPDLGLSDSWCAGVGARIAAYATSAGPHVQGMYLVTHNRTLLRELVKVDPHFVLLGEDFKGKGPSLQEWIDSPIVPRFDLESLGKLSHERFLSIQRVIKATK